MKIECSGTSDMSTVSAAIGRPAAAPAISPGNGRPAIAPAPPAINTSAAWPRLSTSMMIQR